MSQINAPVTTEAAATPKATTKRRKLSTRSIELRVARMLSAKAKAKSLYEECDRIEAELIAAIKTDVTLGDGRVVRVKNNFIDANGAAKNVAFKPCGVKMWEIVVK